MHSKTNRASILLSTLLLATVAVLVAYAIFDLALSNYRLSQRNEYLARARALADSELEYIYFQIQMAMRADACAAPDVPSNLQSKGFCDISGEGDDTFIPTTDRTPFSLAAQAAPEGWVVRRSIVYDFKTLGTINSQTSVYSYFTVKVEVKADQTPVGPLDIRLGRRINTAKSSIFQYNIFAQGNLEFAPGNNVTINGDVASNGSIYIGAQNNLTSNLILNAAVRYLASGTINTSNLANGTIIKPPIWGTSEAAQTQTMGSPINLLGGLSAHDIAVKYGNAPSADYPNPNYNALFGSVDVDASGVPDPAQLALAMNRVYRAVLTPPPDAEKAAFDQGSNGTSYLTDYPNGNDSGAANLSSLVDDPSIAGLRAYNHAGLRITVNGDGSMTFAAPGVTTQHFNSATDTHGLVRSTTMYDLREKKNVAITEVDIGALTAQINSLSPSFNGMLYVYLANASPDHPAAVRLVNGAITPTYDDMRGFSVATNGGLYVKGDYNTATPYFDDQHNPVPNPAMLMGDAITILSSNWDDNRVTPQASDPADVVAWKTTPDASISAVSCGNNYGGTDYGGTYGYRTAASGVTRIGAGLLTGNITASPLDGSYVYSGGGHNLVRFLEDWSNSSVDFYGSIGRLFESAIFNSPFASPSLSTYKYVYDTPQTRTFTFNDFLKDHSPYGTPSPTTYDRGTIFTW